MNGVAVLLVCACGAVASSARADMTGTFSNGFGTAGGGEFLFTPTGDFNGLVLDPFLTFTLERNEHLDFQSTFIVVGIDTAADSGGLGGGDPDPLDEKTAWLYQRFLDGSLADLGYYYGRVRRQVRSATVTGFDSAADSGGVRGANPDPHIDKTTWLYRNIRNAGLGYRYGTVRGPVRSATVAGTHLAADSADVFGENPDPLDEEPARLRPSFGNGSLADLGNRYGRARRHARSANALQNVIWGIEGELGEDWTPELELQQIFYNAAVANADGLGDVRVLNITWQNGRSAQSQLVLVPLPGSLLLGAVGMAGVGFFRRRFA